MQNVLSEHEKSSWIMGFWVKQKGQKKKSGTPTTAFFERETWVNLPKMGLFVVVALFFKEICLLENHDFWLFFEKIIGQIDFLIDFLKSLETYFWNFLWPVRYGIKQTHREVQGNFIQTFLQPFLKKNEKNEKVWRWLFPKNHQKNWIFRKFSIFKFSSTKTQKIKISNCA